MEKNCFSLDWKIENFSYGSEIINSPEFILDGDLCRLNILPKSVDCRLVALLRDYEFPDINFILSFLPCDDSSPLVAEGKRLQVSKEVLFKTRRSSFLPNDTLTVRLQFPTRTKRGGGVVIQSQIGVKSKCFLWTLKNFNDDQHNEKAMKIFAEYSRIYGVVELGLASMDRINSDEQLCIEVSRAGGEQCYCVLKVSLLDVHGNAVNCVSEEYLFKKKKKKHQETWKFPPIIKRGKLFACKDLLLPNDTLSLKCEMAISRGMVTDETSIISYTDDVVPLPKESADLLDCFSEKDGPHSVAGLQGDLKNLLDNETLSDISLQASSSEVVRAHKAILSARSPVFKSLFTDDANEICDDLLVTDLKVETLRPLLLYMYTDAIHDCQDSEVENLYAAADKYQLPGLKQKCSAFLKSKLSVRNVCALLELADVYADSDLEKATLDFISTNSSEVFDSKEWKLLEEECSALAFQALRKICSSKRLE